MERAVLILLSCIAAAVGSVGCSAPPSKLTVTERRHFDPNAKKLSQAGVPSKLIRLAKSDHIALLEKSLNAYKSMPVRDYTCIFSKQERMRGVTGKKQETKVKFKQAPFSVAMTWIKNPPQGDRLIYVAGKYKNKAGLSQMLVRPKGWAAQLLVGKSVLKLPDGPDALKNTLRPVTMFGFENILKELLRIYKLARKRGELKQGFDGVYDVGGRKCLVIVRILTKKRKEYPYETVFIPIDIKTLMPMRILSFDWNNKFLSNYEYRDVKFNVGLTEKDFTPQANDIQPPKE